MMTYEEAKMQIQAIPEKIWDQLSEPDREAMEMAFSALQAQEAKTQLSAEGTTSDLISRQAAIDVCNHAIDLWHGQLGEGIVIAVKKKIEELPSAQPEIEERKEESAQNVQNEDLILREAAIDALDNIKIPRNASWYPYYQQALTVMSRLPSAQTEPLSDAYTKAVWTWLLDYQIKVAELKGRYTPYDVLSWVVNDWRKEHEGSD